MGVANLKKRDRFDGVKCQGLTQGDLVNLFIGDLDVVAGGFSGLAHTVCFGPQLQTGLGTGHIGDIAVQGYGHGAVRLAGGFKGLVNQGEHSPAMSPVIDVVHLLGFKGHMHH